MTKQEISLKRDEYKLLTISDNSSRACLDLDFQRVIVEQSKDLFPKAYLTSDSVIYSANHPRFFSFRPLKRKPSQEQLDKLQAVIENFHRLSEDINIPEDRRICLKNFALPDPYYLPECWLTTLFPKRLIILWGVTKNNEKADVFLPKSSVSECWDEADKAQRFNIADMFVKRDRIPLGTGYKNSEGYSGIYENASRAEENFDSTASDNPSGLSEASAPLESNFDDTNSAKPSEEEKNSSRLTAFLKGCLLPLALFLLLILLILMGIRSCSDSNSYNKEKDINHGKIVNPSGPSDKDPEENTPKVPNNPNSPSDDDSFGDTNTPDAPNDSPGSDAVPPRGKDDSPNRDNGNGNSNNPPEAKIPKEKTSPPNPYQIEEKKFKVILVEEIPSSDETSAQTKFQIKSVEDLDENSFEVRDWQINGKISLSGDYKIFSPKEPLRYDSVYVINASVFIKGKQQTVEPFQWNCVDPPTWQIFPVEKKAKENGKTYSLKCCNSSLVDPDVKKWEISFHDNEKDLVFPIMTNIASKTEIEIKRNIGFYEGAYFMEITANIDYSVRKKAGVIKQDKHTETIPFSHDSSGEALERAKYEAAIPNIYFCLNRQDDGNSYNGTAFAISEKYLLSNYHVAVGDVEVCDHKYNVVGPLQLSNGNGKIYYAKVISSDRKRDLALLRLCDQDENEIEERLPGYLHLGLPEASSNERLSQKIRVFAIGYPAGTTRMGPPAFTDGRTEKILINPTNRPAIIPENVPVIINYTRIRQGFSGGPLIDFATGEVIGVNYGFMSSDVTTFLEGASLAIPVSEVYKAFPDHLTPNK